MSIIRWSIYIMGLLLGLQEFAIAQEATKKCPVALADLDTLKISFLDYSGKEQTGSLTVHHRVADEVLAIFKELKSEGFRINKMRTIDYYDGSDYDSISDDNTSAYNCRAMTDDEDRFSNHAYGLAIDLNPFRNPWVELHDGKYTVARAATRKYIDRDQNIVGFIRADGAVVRIFKKHGWLWGGDHPAPEYPKDYQHFEKIISELGNSPSW